MCLFETHLTTPLINILLVEYNGGYNFRPLTSPFDQDWRVLAMTCIYFGRSEIPAQFESAEQRTEDENVKLLGPFALRQVSNTSPSVQLSNI